MKKYIHCFKKYIFLKVAGERYKIQKGHIFLKILINILIQCWFEIEDFNKNYIKKIAHNNFFCEEIYLREIIFFESHIQSGTFTIFTNILKIFVHETRKV